MIEIPLTQGQVAIVDDEFAELAKFKWCVSWIKKMGVYACTVMVMSRAG